MTSIAATSTLTSATAAASGSSSAYSGMTADDFIVIMLTELLNQDPLEPSKTSDMVVNMREVQELLNAQQEAERSDLEWASNLVGRTVTVSQSLLTQTEYDTLVDAGLSPDIGASSVTGTVTGFRSMSGSIWVSIDGHDYPVANVTSLDTAATTAATISELAAALVGRTVGYADATAGAGSGTVTAVGVADDGSIALTVDGTEVPFSSLVSVS